MAGIKGRSGRRTLLELPDGFSLPVLGDTEESVREFLRAVVDALVERVLDPRIADTLNHTAAVHLRSITAEKQRGLTDQLATLERHVAELQRRGLQREAAQRHHQDDDG